MDKLKYFLSKMESSNEKLIEQLAFFNNKKYFDRSLLGRVENVVNFISDHTSHISYSDLTKRHFALSKDSFESMNMKITTGVQNLVNELLENNELINEITSKPALTVNRLADENLTFNDNEKFRDFTSFEKVGAFEMTKHSSIKLNSLLLIDKKYLVVCSNEKKYKIWHLVDEKFSLKMKNLIGTDTPFDLVHESDEKLHKSFVTALEYIRLHYEHYLVVSGDALGNALVCRYEFNNGQRVDMKVIKSFQTNDSKIKVNCVLD